MKRKDFKSSNYNTEPHFVQDSITVKINEITPAAAGNVGWSSIVIFGVKLSKWFRGSTGQKYTTLCSQ